ncbi:MAG: hypothetical protein Q9225_001049 [Loekoesia sp. 1 TL-2023]
MPTKKSKSKLSVRGQADTDLSRSHSASIAYIPVPSIPLRNHSTRPTHDSSPNVSNTIPLSIYDQSSASDHARSSDAPPDNIIDDPYGVHDPYGVRETQPVVDRGELWYVIDDSNRREVGRREWEEAQQIEPSAKAEDLYPEEPDQFAMSYSEWSRRRVDELLKHREARRCGLIKDEDIYDAIRAGSTVTEQLRDRERRWILDKEGIPSRRPITIEDLDTLFENYVKLLGAPGHQVPGCTKCETASAQGKLYSYTIVKRTREGGKSDEQWHYRSKKEANEVERACNKFLRALVGFARQEKNAKEKAPIVAENFEREKAGKKPIPLNETCVEKWVREIEEGTRRAPAAESDSKSESKEEAAKRWEKEFKASQEVMDRMRTEEDEQRTKIAWQRYKSQERLLQMRGASAVENLERPYSKFSDYYPVGLPYKGKLVHDKADIAPEDWDRFKESRCIFEEEEGTTLPAGLEKEQWDKYIDSVLEEYKPPRGILTSKPKGTHLETLFSKNHLHHTINTPLL